ncbi:ATP-binding protein [Viridibacillus sp. NPDC096237]|uniref:sensor histidine kinase n=1 Tax=Viridibacillus sp. NPDC096237 TaxID=3390721 RepID=UPI003CFE047E
MLRQPRLATVLIPLRSFITLLTLYITVGSYVLYISYSSPIIGIQIEKQDNRWMIEQFEYPVWAQMHQIKKGDVLIAVDDVSLFQLEHITRDGIIRSAKTLTVMDAAGNINEIDVLYPELPYSFSHFFILPVIYFFLMLSLAIYLYKQQSNNVASLNILIYFLLTVSLAYCSVGVSIQLHPVGSIINSTCLFLCLGLLINFLQKYFAYLHIPWRFNKNIWILYVITVSVFLVSMVEIFNSAIFTLNMIIILVLFVVLIFYILIILATSYARERIIQFQILFWFIILPFLPFIIFYVLPELLFQQAILSASTCTLSLLCIPFTFIFMQMTERLFEVNYYISRLRYYVLFAGGMTIWLMIGINSFLSVSIRTIIGIALFIFISILVLLYVKEKIDYVNRKVLFSTNGNNIHFLYSIIDKIGKETKMEALFTTLCEQLMKQLEMSTVYIVQYDEETEQISLANVQTEANTHHLQITPEDVQQLQVGEIEKCPTFYVACLHQNIKTKYFLILSNNSKIHLKKEELLWLELLLHYIDNFVENTQLVEGLLLELKQAKEGQNYPTWLHKLLWLQLEEVKSQLGQELHDTILQEQIFLIRELDNLLYERDSDPMQQKILQLHQQLITVNVQLRQYCEQLKPPLLQMLGLEAALTKLFNQIENRAHFTLMHSIKSLQIDDDEMSLLIYRLIQEMLNNALTHSKATYVKIELRTLAQGFHLFYMDNGVGCHSEELYLSGTMGLIGMKERVAAYKGTMVIESYPDEGMQIDITVGG